MDKPVLCVEDLVVRKGGFLLDRVSFTLAENEIMAVIGRTGSGKTLLLETVAGFCEPLSGAVLYEGVPIRRIPLHRRNIGYLYQDYSLFPHMTVEANLAYPLKLRHVPASEIRTRTAAMADRFGIRHILKQYPGTLSGGEQQRTALARALMLRVPLLLLDEPFSALDPVTKSGLYQLLLDVRRDFGCALLFVTHDFSEAAGLADRVGVLLGGRLRGVLPADELFTADWDDDVKRFLGIADKETIS
ncbi:MAG: ATP-binding cassette domain-containing protein [Oscillospiraceae bacterium]|nr:ATP-binding cassette domain-containing protein [Oscillospiraceae bacterium]